MCCGYVSACSSACAFGMTSLSTNWRTAATISVCNSVSPAVCASFVMGDPASLLAWPSCPHAFEHGSQPLASADAHRLQSVSAVAPVQFTCERREHPASGRTDGMAEGDARALDVRPLQVRRGELPLPHHRQRLRGEGLVELDQV